MSKRRCAREMAVQMLFQSDLGSPSISSIFSDFQPWEYAVVGGPDQVQAKQKTHGAAASERIRNDMDGAFDYAKSLVTGTLEHLDEIDALIRQQAEHWRLERMPAVDRNILRLAIFEFLYEADVPKLVVLDEAIELAKAFGSEQSGSFVNGVLDGVLKSHTLPGTLT